MNSAFKTDRLLITRLSATDAHFILRLVNSEDWIKFIGDRHVKTIADAGRYIEKINSNADITYWVARLVNDQTSLGIVTFIKRDYLEYYDIGFAFLPEHNKKGFAFEASLKVLKELLHSGTHKKIVAITVRENFASVQLLKKLGFVFIKEFRKNNEDLLLYSVAAENFNNLLNK